MEEVWLPVKGYEDYEISSLGRIRSLTRTIPQKNGRERVARGRLISPKQSGAYLGVSLYKNAQERRHYLHRLVAEAFIPNPDQKPCVNHINFDRYNNTVSNLEWVTYQENTAHLIKYGSPNPNRAYLRGTQCHSAVFNENLVKQIRQDWQPGQTADFARRYGVSHRAMVRIVSGDTWKHVDPPRACRW